MTNNSNFKFSSFRDALMALHMFIEYYAGWGFHISAAVYENAKVVHLSIFHYSWITIIPPEFLIYSTCFEQECLGTYWTSIDFDY